MTTACDGRAFWTPAEAIVWICTRNLERVAAIRDPAAPAAILRVMRTYGIKWHIPINDDGSLAGEIKPVGHDDWVGVTPARALEMLLAASRGAVVHMQGQRAGSKSFEAIPPVELVDLRPRITPGNLATSWGLWSESRNELAWTLVQFDRDDVMRKWRPPTSYQVKAARVDRAITAHLWQVMSPESPLTKHEAFKSCKNAVPGFYRGAFERAWKYFPVERKKGRGKHGPRVLKVA